MSSEATHRSRKPFRDPPTALRVGVPWRTVKEEAAGLMAKMENYLRAVREAGGEPVLISLATPPGELDSLADTLDAVVLPGSPADVDPIRYGTPRHPQCSDPDPQRERTDFALLDHAFATNKPVLAICYGVQLLNVYLNGKLLQDIPTEFRTKIKHDRKGRPPGSEDPRHAVRIEPGSKLAQLVEPAGAGLSAEVNSSHHQAISSPGFNLRITAQAPDGLVEAVEWMGSDKWVMGVQWHPERLVGDPFAQALFRELMAAARGAATPAGERARQP